MQERAWGMGKCGVKIWRKWGLLGLTFFILQLDTMTVYGKALHTEYRLFQVVEIPPFTRKIDKLILISDELWALQQAIHRDAMLKIEQARPTIKGPKVLALKYGADFPLTTYTGYSATGEKLTCSLTREFNKQQLGTHEYIVKTEDEKRQTTRYQVVKVEVKDITPPTLTVPTSFQAAYGEKIDLMAGVSAEDLETGELTQQVVLKVKPDFSKSGQQELIYVVSDDAGHEVEKRALLTIAPPATRLSTSATTSSAVTSQEGTTDAVETGQKPKDTTTTYHANRIYVGGQEIYYANGGTSSGMAIINGNPNGVASSYYGASFKGDDGDFTHFIGHNPGAFAVVQNISVGSTVIVTDAAGTPYTYHVYRIYDLAMTQGADGLMYPDSSEGQELVDGLAYHESLGEQVILQTCLTKGNGRIRLAYCR